jgi:hypothetical protein
MGLPMNIIESGYVGKHGYGVHIRLKGGALWEGWYTRSF